MSFRTLVVIPVLAVQAGDGMGEKTVFMPAQRSTICLKGEVRTGCVQGERGL